MNYYLIIMKRLFLVVLASVVLFFSGCMTLSPPIVTFHSPLEGYKYVYIVPTSEKSSVVGVYSGGYGIYGVTTSYSANPADLISGYFLERGFTRIPEILLETASSTLVVNYGETESGYFNLGRKVGIIIQIISAQTNDVICVCKGEGEGDNDAAAVRNAVNRCMDSIFGKSNQQKTD